VDATYLVMSSHPTGLSGARGVSDPKWRRTTKTCQRLGETCTDRQRSIVAVITTVSAAPAEPNMRSTVRSRLKHVAWRAEVFTDRLGVRVWLRLPLAAGLP